MSEQKNPLDDSPLVLVAPELRCGYRERTPGHAWCARPAVCVRPGSAWELPVYVCGRHATAADVPLSAIAPFRRVRLMAQVDFAAVTFAQRFAEEEALEQFGRAVTAAGGLLTNVTASSAIVRQRPPSGALDANSDKG